MKQLCLVLVVLGAGCATVQSEALPVTASALEAVKSAWKSLCAEPAPELVEKCADAKAKINTAIDVYSSANDAAKEAQ